MQSILNYAFLIFQSLCIMLIILGEDLYQKWHKFLSSCGVTEHQVTYLNNISYSAFSLVHFSGPVFECGVSLLLAMPKNGPITMQIKEFIPTKTSLTLKLFDSYGAFFIQLFFTMIQQNAGNETKN